MSSTDPHPPLRNAGPSYLAHALATVVLVASLLMVVAYWRSAQRRELRVAESEFVAESAQVTELLRQRLVNFELITRGGASLFASLQQPTRAQWRDYVHNLNLRERAPSFRGLGFAIDLQAEQLDALRYAVASDLPLQVRPAGVRERYGVAIYLDPVTQQNERLIGYDMYADPARREAMKDARDRGVTRLTAPLPLYGSGGTVQGMVLYSPVFTGGTVPSLGWARQESMRGWVFAPIRIDVFVERTLQAFPHKPRFRIVDVSDAGERMVHVYGGYGASARQGRDAPAFAASIPLDALGRRWRVDFESESRAAIQDRIPGLRTTLLAGILASLLLFFIALALARTQASARALADRMTDSYRRSEGRFRSAMQYSAIGKALLDREGTIIEANPALAQILGKSQEALAGTALGAHFVDGEEESLRTREGEAIADGVHRTTRRLRRSDGDVRVASLTFANVPGEIGHDIARLVQVEDITERKRAEARVHALNRTLEARVALRTRELTLANEELESFAYSVSHDLRAPLRSIDGFSRILQERYAAQIDDSGRDQLARIRAAANRMSELIDALLKMSRLSRGDLKRQDLDLSRMAEDVVADLRRDDPDRSIAVRIEPGLRAEGDPSLIRNLLENLLGNAWKFTRDKPDARIALGRDGDGGFFVRDNGAGFPAEYAGKLFRPFQRLHAQEAFSGHGIGLASVKRIVERHGGSIRAEGVEGEGATFRFRLPDQAAG